MYRQILESIEGIGIYPVISLIIFFLFFSVLIIWLLRIDKGYLKKMEQMPFDNSDLNKITTGDYNEIK